VLVTPALLDSAVTVAVQSPKRRSRIPLSTAVPFAPAAAAIDTS